MQCKFAVLIDFYTSTILRKVGTLADNISENLNWKSPKIVEKPINITKHQIQPILVGTRPTILFTINYLFLKLCKLKETIKL